MGVRPITLIAVVNLWACIVDYDVKRSESDDLMIPSTEQREPEGQIALPIPAYPSPVAAGTPTDERPVRTSEVRPLPITGGTLLLTHDGEMALAADPERDRVSVVLLDSDELLHTIELDSGDEPGRLVEDGNGLVHVVLRGAAQVATIEPLAGTVVSRRDVCTAPRGIAYDESENVLHVACMTGALWTLPESGAGVIRQLSLTPDLRDVIVDDSRVWVTRFRSAELIELNTEGAVVRRLRPNAVHSGRGIRATEVPEPRFAPNGAFRTVLGQDGSVVMLHQRALEEPIKIDPNMPASLNGYYGGTCGGIVESAVTVFRPDGERIVSGSLRGTLAVDLATFAASDLRLPEAPDAPPRPLVQQAAVVFAGQPDPESPMSRGASPALAGTPPAQGLLHEVPLFESLVSPGDEPPRTCEAGPITPTIGQSVAVAARTDGTVVIVQSREPAQLEIFRKPRGSTLSVVSLGGPPLRNTGHEMFHRTPRAGVTCASCHLEGGDDGHVWNFDPLGPRRTQSANAGLAGTEPFHWDGDMPNLQALVEEVMVVRMGGAHQSGARVEALGNYMFALPAPPPRMATTDDAVERGKVLFESESLGCAGCHSGATLTNNQSYDVGTGGPLQVPPLRGVGYRAPFLHDGCADTLRGRFEPECGGGDRHGRSSALSDAEIDDLVAYLQSL